MRPEQENQKTCREASTAFLYGKVASPTDIAKKWYFETSEVRFTSGKNRYNMFFD